MAAVEAQYRTQLAAEADAGKSPYDVLYCGGSGAAAGLGAAELEGGEGAASVKLFTYVDKDGFVPCSEVRRKLSTSVAGLACVRRGP